jgi:hypothetical protein
LIERSGEARALPWVVDELTSQQSSVRTRARRVYRGLTGREAPPFDAARLLARLAAVDS